MDKWLHPAKKTWVWLFIHVLCIPGKLPGGTRSGMLQYTQENMLAVCFDLFSPFSRIYIMCLLFTHIGQGYFNGIEAGVWLASVPVEREMGKISLYKTTTKREPCA